MKNHTAKYHATSGIFIIWVRVQKVVTTSIHTPENMVQEYQDQMLVRLVETMDTRNTSHIPAYIVATRE